MLWLRKQPDLSGIFNVGTGRAQTWLELMTALYGAVGREPLIEWIDVPETIRDHYQYFTQADMTALRQAGYERPFLSVEEGVADYVRNYLATDDPYR
jgi:ADP-L-glycero-D-manno-heptose 6-epimerase